MIAIGVTNRARIETTSPQHRNRIQVEANDER
jgi:hypothetical protein